MSSVSVLVDGLGRRYGRRWALAHVSFALTPSTTAMLIGQNGAGKSTLLRVLATALRPDRGRVLVGGFDVVANASEVRRSMAIIGHADYLYDALTAEENLRVVAQHMRMKGRGFGSLLERVGLGPRARDLVSTFSAGMRKRLAFARLLLQEPRLVLLDEPYGALDPSGFDMVDDIVRSLQRSGATLIISTHHWERVAQLASEALLLEEGQLVWRGNAGDAAGRSPKVLEAVR